MSFVVEYSYRFWFSSLCHCRSTSVRHSWVALLHLWRWVVSPSPCCSLSFCLAPDTPYEGGYYHGKLVGHFQLYLNLLLFRFSPLTFPFGRPLYTWLLPMVASRLTPACVFPFLIFIQTLGTHRGLSRRSSLGWFLSVSSSHARLLYSVLLLLVNETASTLGSVNTTTQEKRILAARSKEYNLRDPVFWLVFEELAKSLREEVEEERRTSGTTEASGTNNKNEEPKS